MQNNLPRDYYSNFLNAKEGEALLTMLRNQLDRKCYEIQMFGKTYKQPRLVSYYADPGTNYSYSQTHLSGTGWHSGLENIKKRIEKKVESKFNSVLCNLYRNGSDGMGRHADDEPSLGPDPIIASLSLGEERCFHLKQRLTNEKVKLMLEHGSLLVMKKGCQKHWLHAMMKTTKEVGVRINLTFRNIIDTAN